MNCKNCGAQLKEDEAKCPECGMAVRKRKQIWKKVIMAICGVALLGVLVCAVLYGLGILDFKAPENKVTDKDSYSVSDRKALKKADVVVATAGDQTLTNGELQIYYNLEVVEFISTYSNYLEAFGLDYRKPLDEQMSSKENGTTWQHTFIDNAINAWYTYAVLNEEAKIQKFPINSELQQMIDALPESLLKMANESGFSSVQEMLTEDFGGACKQDAYLEYLEEYYIAMAYFGSVYDELKPTDAEIEAYFKENEKTLAESGIKKDSGKYVDVRHILIKPEGGTKDGSGNSIYSEDEWEACRKEAQAILDQWLAGEATEGSFGALANQYSEDPGSNTNGGLYTQVADGDMKAAFNDWIFAEDRKDGDYGLVKTDIGYHVMYFVGSEDIWMGEVRSTILSERVDKFVEQIKAKYPIEKNYKKIVLGEVALT